MSHLPDSSWRSTAPVIWSSSGSESEDDRKMPALRHGDAPRRAQAETGATTWSTAPPPQKVLSADEALAAKIQSQEWEQRELSVRKAQERKQLELASMTRTLKGQAWIFIEKVIDLQKKLSTQYPGLQTVAVDDMVFLAEQFIQCQQAFRQKGIDPTVTLAYHYTTDQSMDSIQQDGLMTLPDREKKGIQSRFKGTFYGDGVYTATNPYAFQNYGDVGLLVAVLLGKSGRVLPGGQCPFASGDFINTAIGNKSVRNIWEQVSDDAKLYDELVLKESKQCLPLFRYDVTLVSSTWQGKVGADAIWSHQAELQMLINQFFNVGCEIKLERILPSTGLHYAPPVKRVKPIMSFPSIMSKPAAFPAPLSVAALPTKQPPNSWFQPGAFPTSSIASANVLSKQPAATPTMKPGLAFGCPTQQPPNSWFQPGAFATNSIASANVPAQQPAATPATKPGLGFGCPTQQPPNSWFQPGAFATNSIASANVLAQQPAPTPATKAGLGFGCPTQQPPNSWFQAGAFSTNSIASANVLAQQPVAFFAMANGSIHNTPPTVLASHSSPALRSGQPHPPVFGGRNPFATLFPVAHQILPTAPLVAAATLRQSISDEVLTYTAPAMLNTSTPSDAFESCVASPFSDDECPICMEVLNTSGQVVKIRVCGHEYHLECIQDALKINPKCPICRKSINNPQGHSPSGEMIISSSARRCSGFEDYETIVIDYLIPGGFQMAYHPFPGRPFRGGKRTAYLPNNEDGRKLLERLKLAWMLGLTFTVGESLTSGRSNVVTWASIHHKTSSSGGSHGFPDPAYFSNCNEELDSLGVPQPLQF